MKHVLGYAAKVVFYLFCLAVLGWTATLTISFVSKVLPGSQVEPYLALAVFDGGAITWCLVFLFYAKGLGQRAIGLICMILDLCGVALMTVAELLLGGQTFTTPPADLGTAAVWTIGLVTFANLAAAYAFHVLDPGAMRDIQTGVAKDKVEAKGLKYLEDNMDKLGEQLGAEMGAAYVAAAVRDMGLHLPAGQAAQTLTAYPTNPERTHYTIPAPTRQADNHQQREVIPDPLAVTAKANGNGKAAL